MYPVCINKLTSMRPLLLHPENILVGILSFFLLRRLLFVVLFVSCFVLRQQVDPALDLFRNTVALVPLLPLGFSRLACPHELVPTVHCTFALKGEA